MTASYKPARAGEGRSSGLIPATRVTPITQSVCLALVVFPGDAPGQGIGLDSDGINVAADSTCAGSGSAVGTNNICIGDDNAGQSLSGSFNQISGFRAGQNLSGGDNLVSGLNAGQFLSGFNNQLAAAMPVGCCRASTIRSAPYA